MIHPYDSERDNGTILEKKRDNGSQRFGIRLYAEISHSHLYALILGNQCDSCIGKKNEDGVHDDG
ncbi:hypothetical protein GCM10009000_080980 [Halobacterium noricense]|uniref:Transposase n=1 Tax=Haladaptatus pallidirubidus TaxID=1008152 RepID=A0AAV3UB26_9EURY